MNLEERGLPPFFNYINVRLTGRPLHAAIWVILMLTICASVYKLDAHRGVLGDFIMIAALFFILIVVAALVSVSIRSEGRKWLLAKYDYGERPNVSYGSRMIIRLLPLLGLLVVIEYCCLGPV